MPRGVTMGPFLAWQPSGLNRQFGERIFALPPFAAGPAEAFEAADGDLGEDRVDIERDGAAAGPFAGEQRRSGMSEGIDHPIRLRRGAADDPLERLQGLLRIAAGDVLVQAVEDLLDVHPDVPGPDRIRLAARGILGPLAGDLLVIAAQDLRYVGIFGGDVEMR